MISQKLLKSYEFKTREDYYNYVIESYINGQFTQCQRLINKMSLEDKEEFLGVLFVQSDISLRMSLGKMLNESTKREKKPSQKFNRSELITNDTFYQHIIDLYNICLDNLHNKDYKQYEINIREVIRLTDTLRKEESFLLLKKVENIELKSTRDFLIYLLLDSAWRKK